MAPLTGMIFPQVLQKAVPPPLSSPALTHSWHTGNQQQSPGRLTLYQSVTWLPHHSQNIFPDGSSQPARLTRIPVMSIMMEVSPLEGIDTEGTPPCEVILKNPFPHDCGNPSAYRVSTRCAGCGKTGIVFICEDCREMEAQGRWECSICERPARIGRFC